MMPWRRMQLPRQLRFTREGKYFFWVTIGIGVGAVNTGNNLLYLLLGMLLSLIIVSGVLSNSSLRGLEVQRLPPSRLFAKTPCLITLIVTNTKTHFPSFSIEIEDRIEGRPKGKKCYFLKISPGREQKTAYRLELPTRGTLHFQEVLISTKFPFSLFVKSCRLPLEEDVIVYPHISPIPRPPIGPSLFQHGHMPHPTRGQGSHFFALREMRPGDELRWIHWPSSARAGKWQVREFEEEQRPHATLMLWNVLPASISEEDGDQYIDSSVELAASLLVAFLEKGHPVHFATANRRFPLISSKEQLEPLLIHLALLNPHKTPPTPLPSPFPHLLVLLPPQTPPPQLSTPFQTLKASPSPALPS